MNLTPEEKKVTLFLLAFAFCGIILNSLIKLNCRLSGMIYPQVRLAQLNLNQVSLSEISKIQLIPPSITRAIIEYRNLHQGFSSLEELQEVPGIGPQRFEKLKEIFFVE